MSICVATLLHRTVYDDEDRNVPHSDAHVKRDTVLRYYINIVNERCNKVSQTSVHDCAAEFERFNNLSM